MLLLGRKPGQSVVLLDKGEGETFRDNHVVVTLESIGSTRESATVIVYVAMGAGFAPKKHFLAEYELLGIRINESVVKFNVKDFSENWLCMALGAPDNIVIIRSELLGVHQRHLLPPGVK